MKFDAVFFDLGGTLYSDEEIGKPTWAEVSAGQIPRVLGALKGFGVEVEAEPLSSSLASCAKEGKQRLGDAYTFYQLMLILIEDMSLGLGPEEAACLADAYAGPRYESWLFPGTKETIDRLSSEGL